MPIRYLSTNNEYEGEFSRYQVLRVIENEGLTYLETFNQVEIPTSDSDTYHIVTHKEVNRLDMIANTYYSDARLWWVIAIANNMIDPFIVNEGVMLRVPSMVTVNQIFSNNSRARSYL